MKRYMTYLLAAVLSLSLVAGCSSAASSSSSASSEAVPSSKSSPVSSETSSQPSSEASSAPEASSSVEPEEELLIRAAVLKGPTGIGMVKLMDDAEAGTSGNAYTFSMSGSADEIVPAIVKGEIDIAAVPANLASVLYNKTNGGVQVLAINNLGVLYVVESGEEIQSVADLKGKTLYSTGKGTTPEFSLNYVLRQNGLDPEKDLTIEYKSEASEVAAMLAEDTAAVAMLPQPFVTSALMNNEKLRVALDLTAEWDSIQQQSGGSSALVTGVVIARTDFVSEHPDEVADFLEEYKASCDFTASNLDDCADLVEKYGIVAKAAIAKKAIPACNISYIDGAEMKEKVSGYLGVLFEQKPESVGGVLPGDDFYYGA